MRKIFKILTALFLFLGAFQAKAEQFVSLNLCADRLLIALAEPSQIAAMSPYSQNGAMMLDKVNIDKPTVEPKLVELLPYLDKTVLVNETFYPQLIDDLKRLNVKIVPINDSPQSANELFALIRRLGALTENQAQAEQLVAKLQAVNLNLQASQTDTLILSDTGIVESDLPQYQTLLALLGLTPLKTELTEQNFSLEKVLLSQPNVLISLTDNQGYNEQAELLTHPLLQNLFKNTPSARIPMKYTYCFDHGVWQGAELISKQFNQFK